MAPETLLERCRKVEERAAALYRRYAAAARAEPSLCALWTALAREEEQHVRAIAEIQAAARPTGRWRARLEGCDEALAELDGRVQAAEQLGAGAPAARQLSAALALATAHLGAPRNVLAAAGDGAPATHALRLADAAERLSHDPHVRLHAAMLRARAQLGGGAPPGGASAGVRWP